MLCCDLPRHLKIFGLAPCGLDSLSFQTCGVLTRCLLPRSSLSRRLPAFIFDSLSFQTCGVLPGRFLSRRSLSCGLLSLGLQPRCFGQLSLAQRSLLPLQLLPCCRQPRSLLAFIFQPGLFAQ